MRLNFVQDRCIRIFLDGFTAHIGFDDLLNIFVTEPILVLALLEVVGRIDKQDVVIIFTALLEYKDTGWDRCAKEDVCR
ncbi:hypothetical protein D3C78_1853690 [compost metagenome]